MARSTGDLEVPATDTAAHKINHRKARSQWKTGPHQQYFLVMDKEGFPPIKNVILRHRAVFPEVWVYDVDWRPPADGNRVHDEDGYQGRLRVLKSIVSLFQQFYVEICSLPFP
jgi:hypothetical protein